MSTAQAHFLGWWPMFVAGVTGICATVIAIRYKLPELTKRVEAVEKDRANYPKKIDIEKAVDSFHNICKFNQVSCQKVLDAKMAKVKQDLEDRLADLHELMNQQAILMARVDERIAHMHNNGAKRLDDCNGGQQCLFIKPSVMLQNDEKWQPKE